MATFKPDITRSKRGQKQYRKLLLWGLIILLIAFFLQLFTRLLLVYPYRVSSEAMQPALPSDTTVFVAYPQLVNLKDFDIVLVQNPVNGLDQLCRIVAREGKRISIKDKEVFVNGAKLDLRRKWADSRSMPAHISDRDNMAEIPVRPDHFFCLNDNHDDFSDSRQWGPFHIERIQGKIIYKGWIFQSLN